MTSLKRHATPRFKRQAFTLAELLISLAILGVIATFTIPKVLNLLHANDRKTIWKAAISQISALTYNYSLEPQSQTLAAYIRARLNFVKICPNTVMSDGCRTIPTNNPSVDNRSGGVMPDGSVYTMGAWPNSMTALITIDYNGDLPPNDALNTANYEGDTLHLVANGANTPITYAVGYEPVPPQKVLPWGGIGINLGVYDICN